MMVEAAAVDGSAEALPRTNRPGSRKTKLRNARHQNRMWEIISNLPPPGGPTATSTAYSPISGWQQANDPVLDWANMPASCDPCLLLDTGDLCFESVFGSNAAAEVQNVQADGSTHTLSHVHDSGSQPDAVLIHQSTTNTSAVGALKAPLLDQSALQSMPNAVSITAPAPAPATSPQAASLPEPTSSASTLPPSAVHASNSTAARHCADTVKAEQLRSRGQLKRHQVDSFTVILRRLLHDPQRRYHLVDFGCGSGGLLLPLAARFPHCTFTGIDYKDAAVSIVRVRARRAGLTNVRTFSGMIESFNEPFDVGLALHACGNATDHALLQSVRWRAAYVANPCCVGKLKFSVSGGSSFHPLHRAYLGRQLHTGGAQGISNTVMSLHDDDSTSAARPLEEVFPAFKGRGAKHNGMLIRRLKSHAEAAQSAHLSSAAHANVATAVAQEGTNGLAVPATSSAADSVSHHQDGPHMSDRGLHSIASQVLSPTADHVAVVDTTALVTRQAPEVAELQHPRSQWLRDFWHPDPKENFLLLAKVADTNHSMGQGKVDITAINSSDDDSDGENGMQRKAERAVRRAHVEHVCKLCKLHVEIDRNMAAKEQGYCVGLTRVIKSELQAKGDVLIGVPREDPHWAGVQHLLQG